MFSRSKLKSHSGRVRGPNLESLETRCLLDGDALELVRYESAAALEDKLLSDALTQYEGLFGQQGSPWDWGFWPEGPWFECPVCDFVVPFAEDAAGGALPPDHSDTNTQVAGVDEADIVETDGDFLYMLSGQELIIADAWQPDELGVLSRMEIQGQPVGEFLNGDRLTIVSTNDGYQYSDPFFGPNVGIAIDLAFVPYYESDPKTILTVVDIADRNNPEVIQTTEIEGSYTSSRAIGDTVYLISTDDFAISRPELECDDNDICVYETREQFIERVEGQILDLALPNYSTVNKFGMEVASGLVTQATDVFKPTTDSSPNLITVSAFDTSVRVPDAIPSVSVPATYSTTVFGSTGSLYVTNPDWGTGWGFDEATSVFKFDLIDNGKDVDLSAVGQIPGRLLNSFSMNEYQDVDGETYFHAATTRGWGADSDNRVFVMQQNGDQLETVGKTERLAPGEQIFSVRYNDTTAYVVTFVQTDPLFTIDLSNPTAPEVKGELHITGFSNYLQPVGQNYLVGLGRDADPNNGRAQELQINLFDVNDLSDPRLADRYNFTLPDWAWSEAISEHHAVGYYPEHQVLAIPVTNEGWIWVDRDGNGDAETFTYRPQTELYVFQLTLPEDENRKAGIELLGTIEHDASIRRSVRIEDFLYSISDETVSIHEIQNPSAEVARIHFGRQDVGVAVYAANVEDPSVSAAIESPETTAPQVVGVSTSSTNWGYDFVNYLDFDENANSESLSILPMIGTNQIKVQFTEDVIVGQSDLTIQSKTNQPYSIQSFNYDIETYTATWTLNESLVGDQVSLKVNGVRDTSRSLLDGNANGRSGGSFNYEFRVLPGDVDRDGIVDRADLKTAMSRVGANAGDDNYLLSNDVDGNGHINYADFDLIQSVAGTSLPGYVPPLTGDSNGDGTFDTSDLVIVLQGGLYRTGEIATYAQGDWNRDGVFNESDFTFAFQAGTYAFAAKSAESVVDSIFADDERFDDGHNDWFDVEASDDELELAWFG